MCHQLLRDASFHRYLFTIDADLAAKARSGGCPSCQGVLHGASYPRKPRGAPGGASATYDRRHSFCCSAKDCRRRLTPPSVRFLDHRVYVSAMVVLAAVLAHGLNRARCWQLCKQLEVDPATLARWQKWWQEQVPRNDFWTELRARLDRPLDPSRLPLELLERLKGANEEERLLALLQLIRPLSHSPLMRTRLASAA